MRKLLLTSVFGASVLLSGCQSTGTTEQLSPEFPALAVRSQELLNQCESRKFQTTTAYMKCLNDADSVVLPALTPQLANVWQLRMDRRTVLAEQVERKQITSAAEITAKLREINGQAMADMNRILGK